MMFVLHPQLIKDTHIIGYYPLCTLLLMNDHRFPWIILVPRVDNIREITDLSEPDFYQFTQDLRSAVQTLQKLHQPHKINIGALGNKVPQMHVHIIARFITDAAWPNPVWGYQTSVAYGPIDILLKSYRNAFLCQEKGFTIEHP